METGAIVNLSFTVLNIMLWVVPVIIIGICMLIGARKGMALSISKLIRVILSVVIAVVITKVLLYLSYDTVNLLVIQMVQDNPEVYDLIQASPSLYNYVIVLATFLVAPIIFLPIYFVTSLILMIPTAIINHFAIKQPNIERQRREADEEYSRAQAEEDDFGDDGEEGEEKPKRKVKPVHSKREFRYKPTAKLSWLWGMLISMLAGIIISTAIFMPLTNYLVKASTYYATLEAEGITANQEKIPEELDTNLVAAKDTTSVKLWATLSTPIFHSLTTYKDKSDAQGDVFKDIDFVASIIPDLVDLADQIEAMEKSSSASGSGSGEGEGKGVDLASFENIDVTPVTNIIRKLKETGNLKKVIVEVLSTAGKKWGGGETFVGLNIKQEIEKEEKTKDLFPYIKMILDKFAALDNDGIDAAIDKIAEFIDSTATFATKAIGKIDAITKMDFEDLSKIDVTPIKGLAQVILEYGSDTLKEILASLLSDASTKWLAGQEFMGLNIKEALAEQENGEMYAEIIDIPLEKLKNTTKDTVADDLNDFADTLQVLVKAYGHVEALMSMDFSDLSTVSGGPVRDIAVLLRDEGNDLSNKLVAKVLSSAAGKWVNGEKFMEVNLLENVPEDFKGALEIALNVLKDTDKDKLVNDLMSFGDAVDVFAESYGKVQELSSTDFSDISKISGAPLKGIADILETKGNDLSKSILAKLISDAGKKWASGGKFADIDLKGALPEDYAGALDPALDVLKNTTKATLANDLNTFADALDVIPQLNEKIDDLKNMNFSDLSSVNGDPIRGIATVLDDSNDLAKSIVANVMSDAGTKWANGEAFAGINIKDQIPDAYKGAIDPALDILKNTTKDTISEDLNTFANALDTLHDVSTKIDELVGIDFSNLEDITTDPIRSISTILNSGANELSREVVANMISEAATKWLAGEEFMGLNIKEQLPDEYKSSLDSSLNLLSNTDKDTVADDLYTFADSITSIQKTYSYVQSLSNEEITREELQENLTDTLKSLTPESAQIISESISGEMFSDLGLSEENNATITDAVSSILGEVANLDEEDRVAEAAALNDIITFVTDTSNEEAKATPEELIGTVVASDIVSSEVVKLTEEEKTFEVSEEVKQSVDQAVDDYIAEKTASGELTDEEQEVLNAIKDLFVVGGFPGL